MNEANDMNRDISMFEQLVMMLASSAMQQLGLLVDPRTGKARPDLAGAAWSIDLMGMLEEKTEGRLDAHESKSLKDALATLRLNYVEVARATPAEQPAAPEPEPPAASAATEAPSGNDAPPPLINEREPKFHKTYA